MKKILVIGAGRSATTMIKYLLDHADVEDWEVTVADYNGDLAAEKVGDHPRGRAIQFDVFKDDQRRTEIKAADLVISLLPPHMHMIPAMDCLALKTHLVTASYVADEMAELDEEVKAAGLIFLNECGADPGIDHMSTMEMVESVRNRGGVVRKFRSYCGALVDPSCNNMWGYKFTWAPRNIILAGQGIAKYMRNGAVKFLPYHQVFRRTDVIDVPGHGKFEAYANRNSLKYAPKYGIKGAETLYRATLRTPGFPRMWNAFVFIGLTDDTYKLKKSAGMTYRDFLFTYINDLPGRTDEESIAAFLETTPDDELIRKIVALDLLSDRKIPLEEASPADILEHILLEKWVFEEDDIDMLVMQHQIEWEKDGERFLLVSSMVDKGRDHDHTAISRTVGLPVAIAARMILNGKVSVRGVRIPVSKDIYAPVLEELEKYDIRFITEEKALSGEGVA